MQRKCVYDTETNGFIKDLDRIHVLVIKDVTDTDKSKRVTHVFRRRSAGEYDVCVGRDDNGKKIYEKQWFDAEDSIPAGVEMLEKFDVRIAHNGIDFDERAIRKVFPDYDPLGKIVDSLIVARVVVPDTKPLDFKLNKQGRIPGHLIGKHSLDAWGYRLGKNKGDYSKECLLRGIDPWAAWNPDMEDYCLTPDHKLLGEDLRWREAREYKVGDTVLGFDEEGRGRKYRKAVIESVKYADVPVFAVTLSNGDVIKTTAEHRWLVCHANRRAQTAKFGWVETQNLRPGLSKVPKLFDVWEERFDKETGWLAGMFDGEGTCRAAARQFSISQNPGAVSDRIVSAFDSFSYVELSARTTKVGARCQTMHVTGDLPDRVRFLGEVRPERLIAKNDFDAYGRVEVRNGTATVVSIEPIGVHQIIKIQTSCRTFIADGYPMHNCVNDVDVNEMLWDELERDIPPVGSIEFESAVADLASAVRNNGFPFHLEEALALANKLEQDRDKLVADVRLTYGTWLAPSKKKTVKARWNYPEDFLADNPSFRNAPGNYALPDTEWGEDLSRAVWGEMKFPARTRRRAERLREWEEKNAKRAKRGAEPLPLPATIDAPDVTEGCPYVPVEWKEFNPGSRHHVIDRFVTLHGWVPQDFTEKGTPEVSNTVLQKLREEIPEAEPLAEIFFLNKYIGQIKDGKESWINNCEEDGHIRCYINTNGAVTGRCTHAAPNMSQVPAVIKKGKDILKGRDGEYGWECRSLFYVPEPFIQCGADLKNIEARAFAAVLAEFDGGKLAGELAAGLDLHDLNMAATGINDRGIMKRVFFGLLYGAGDWKLGATADPTLDEAAARNLGAEYRSLIINKIPGFKEADRLIKAHAKRGYLIGLDGRRLPCRSEHSALNLRLQSDAALTAKKWWVTTEEWLLKEGLNHGWSGDFAMMGFFHDEQQNAVLNTPEHRAIMERVCLEAATYAGEFFGFGCKVEADVRFGNNWAQTH